MKSTALKLALGIFLASGLPTLALVAAEEGTKALPTLLIKGEVVSVDSTDPSAVLLKVKDRYGFETPIFLPQDAKISQGDQTLTVANLATGTTVEVEYNFDINTAKRHAVSVKVAVPTPAAETASAPALAAPAVAAPAAAAPSASPATVQAPASVTPPTQEAAPATQSSPSTP